MRITGEGRRLRIYVNETDRANGTALYEALVRKAHEIGLAGATVLRGISGFGAGSRIHTTKILRMAEDLPVIVELVDSAEKIRAALPALEQLIETAGAGALMTLGPTEIIRYAPAK
jgi:hypothetical protein